MDEGTPTAAGWRDAFRSAVRRYEHAAELRQAAMDEALGRWTKALTGQVVATCEAMGWAAAARGHKARVLPVDQNEYLALDVVAFAENDGRWRFPVAVAELENSQSEDRIAYSLWKVLCVRAPLRLVFCYRRDPDEAPALMRSLERDVVQAMGVEGRAALAGETFVVVGSRSEGASFPDGFFRWHQLVNGTGKFEFIW